MYEGSNFPISLPKFVVCLLILAILVSVKFYLMILIYLSLITTGDKHLFIWLLVLHIALLERCLFKSFIHFLIGSFYRWVVFFKYSGYKSLFRYMMCRFSPICLFTFMMIPFDAETFLILMKSNLFFIWLLVLLLSYLRNYYLIKCHADLHLFSSICFIVLVPTVRSLTHFLS